MSMEEADPIASRGWKKLELDSGLMHVCLSGISQNGERKGKIKRGAPTLCNVPSTVLTSFFNPRIYSSLPWEGKL